VRTIRAGDLVLEPQVEAHAAEMFAVLSDPAIYEFENESPPSEARLAGRFRRLESRRSPDGRERWLNWVVRLPSGELAGYVQAMVRPGRRRLTPPVPRPAAPVARRLSRLARRRYAAAASCPDLRHEDDLPEAA
jgi:hypothetical protein